MISVSGSISVFSFLLSAPRCVSGSIHVSASPCLRQPVPPSDCVSRSVEPSTGQPLTTGRRRRPWTWPTAPDAPASAAIRGHGPALAGRHYNNQRSRSRRGVSHSAAYLRPASSADHHTVGDKNGAGPTPGARRRPMAASRLRSRPYAASDIVTFNIATSDIATSDSHVRQSRPTATTERSLSSESDRYTRHRRRFAIQRSKRQCMQRHSGGGAYIAAAARVNDSRMTSSVRCLARHWRRGAARCQRGISDAARC